ncbi:MAG: ATP-binding protein, partial [Patescibacteria group bacterium]|nr:ATP-binding protein [Patescibacteria group bacterium]
MRIPFVNRKKELETLEQEYEKDFSFVILYGRRRVGKTRLIDEFTKDKRTLNFTVDEINDADNIENFQSQLAKFIGKPYLEQVSFSKWQDAFAQLREVKGKFTLVIDEFPYLIKANKSFPYIFQKIIDKQLRDQEVNVIVSGSSMSLMSDKVLAHKSPLYGRRTAQLRLDPLEFKHMTKFFPKY